MKLVKMLSLAAVAAIAAMAFVGTSSAFAEGAVLLCKKAELKCTEPWPSGTTIVGHATNPKLLSSVGTVECEKSLAEVTVLQTALQKLQLHHILSLNFEGNCHLGGTACTVTVKEVGGISVTHGVNPLEWIGVATSLPLTVEGKEVQMNTIANVKCGFLINCTYTGGEETETTITNNAEGVATVTANEAPLKRSAGFCPETSKWDAIYVGLVGGLWLES